MKNRFDIFNAEEKAMIMIGLCKITLHDQDPGNKTKEKLLDEITK